MLAIDTVVYAALACYLEAIVPSQYGQTRHPLFLLQPSFWRVRARAVARQAARG